MQAERSTGTERSLWPRLQVRVEEAEVWNVMKPTLEKRKDHSSQDS